MYDERGDSIVQTMRFAWQKMNNLELKS